MAIFYLFQKRAAFNRLLPAQKQTNKKIFYERCDSNISFVQKEGSKIVFFDEAGELTVDCG